MGLFPASNLRDINAKLKKLKDLYVSVKEYGAKGDGVTDDGLAIQEAMTYAASCNAGVLFPEGHYMIKGDTCLTLASNMKLKGIGKAILDFSDRTGWNNVGVSNALIYGSGTEGSHINVTVADEKSKTISLANTAGLQAGDLIFITSSKTWPGDTSPANVGELCEVSSVDSATQITVSQALHETYLSSDNAYICKVSPIENVSITNIEIRGRGKQETTDYGQFGIFIAYGKNISVKDCQFKRIDQTCLELCSTYLFEVDNCVFYTDKCNEDRTQYQVRLSSASCYGVVSNIKGTNAKHTVVLGHTEPYSGITRHIHVTNCKSIGTWNTGYTTHNSSEFITYENNEAIGCATGFNIRDRNIRVVNNKVINCTSSGIYLSKRVRDAFISGNTVKGINGGGIIITNNGIDTDAVVENIIIVNNYIDDVTGGINLQCTTNTSVKKGITIRNNVIRNVVAGGNNSGIRMNGNFQGTIEDNDISGGAYGIYLVGCNYFVIQGNDVRSVSSRGVYLDSTTSYIKVLNNSFYGYNRAISLGGGTGNEMIGETNIQYGDTVS